MKTKLEIDPAVEAASKIYSMCAGCHPTEAAIAAIIRAACEKATDTLWLLCAELRRRNNDYDWVILPPEI